MSSSPVVKAPLQSAGAPRHTRDPLSLTKVAVSRLAASLLGERVTLLLAGVTFRTTSLLFEAL